MNRYFFALSSAFSVQGHECLLSLHSEKQIGRGISNGLISEHNSRKFTNIYLINNNLKPGHKYSFILDIKKFIYEVNKIEG